MSASPGDELVWYSEDDPFTITFQTSPFVNSVFHVPAGGSVSSGPVSAGAGVGQYQYFITDDTNGQGGDPDVDVRR
jgi:hypothetical protein